MPRMFLAVVLALTLLGTLAVSAAADTPLLTAVKQQDAAATERLLGGSGRAHVNTPAGDGATPLHWAVYHDAAAMVDRLLAAGAKADLANDLGVTPLHLASGNGNLAILTQLLRKGARSNAATLAGVTPLMEAARHGSVAVAGALLEHGADPNARESSRQQNALMWAVARRHPAVVRVLLAHGADVHARTRVRPLTVMLDEGPRRTVKTAAQDARQVEAGGSTALLFAAYGGDAESAELLLTAGARIDEAGADGNTPLVAAAFAGHGAVARQLLAAGASADAAAAGYTALHAAVLRGDRDTVAALIAKGASLDPRLSKGSPTRRFGSQWALPQTMAGATPAFVAATYLEVDILGMLLAAGAQPSLPITDGTTPLLAAAGAAVERSARPIDLQRWHVIDNDTPQVPRAEPDVRESVRVLLDAGADVNQVNAVGDSALHAAAAAGTASVIQLLADRGAQLTLKNRDGLTPLALTKPRSGRSAESAAAAAMRVSEELLRKLGATY